MAVDFSAYGLFPVSPAPSPRQAEWYTREKTAFFHFGMNTFHNAEWGDGTEDPADFAPETVDCRQWVRAVKEAGFTVGILTAKHHDGFCLWPSAYTEHSVKNSPYKGGNGDIVREFADACREYGLGMGLYLSPWDRHEKTWGTPAYNVYYAAQLTELMSNYGPVAECWWDGAGSEQAEYDWGLWSSIIRDLQPGCVIYGCSDTAPCVDTRWVGNEGGFAGDPCWGTLMAGAAIQKNPGVVRHDKEDRAMLNHGAADGNYFLPAEADVSIRPGWFYHADQDGEVKSPSRLVTYWFDSVGRNAGMLLNLPPMPDGKLHPTDMANIREAHRLVKNIFAFNLLTGSAVETTGERAPELGGDKVLLPDTEKFYAAPDSDPTPTLTFTLPEPRKVNCFRLGEMIALGHRVRRYAVDVHTADGWQTVYEGQCIGYLWAGRFPAAEVTALRLRILAADAAPVLREVGLYLIPDEVFAEENALREKKDLTAGSGATITREGLTTTVNFGGIYPFDTVVFDSRGSFSYLIEAFNGSTWDTVKRGRPGSREIVRFPAVEGAYQMRITLGDGAADGDIRPQVFLQGE